MNDADGPVKGLREVCHDIRQPIAGACRGRGTLAEADLAESARNRLEQIIRLS